MVSTRLSQRGWCTFRLSFSFSSLVSFWFSYLVACHTATCANVSCPKKEVFLFLCLFQSWIGLQKQRLPYSLQRSLARRRPTLCRSSLWRTCSGQGKFWPTSGCLFLQIQFCFPLETYLVGDWFVISAKSRDTRKRYKEVKQRELTNAQTRDDMWMKMFFMRHALRHLESCGACERGWNVRKCARNYAEWGCSLHTQGRSQWIAINFKRSQKRELEQKRKTVSSLPTPFGCVPPRGTCRWRPMLSSSMLINSSDGEVIFGEYFLSLLYSSLLIWMEGISNSFFKFVGVSDFFYYDNGSLISSKLRRPIFASFVRNMMQLFFLSSPFLHNKITWVIFFRKFIPLFALFFFDDRIANRDSR